MHYYEKHYRSNPSTQRFIFATGIECSYPTISVDGSKRRIDQMEKCRHYERWQDDLDLVQELGIRYLRYGLIKDHI